VFLVHGEYDRGMRVMEDILGQCGTKSHMPGMHEPILID
jgi:metallo-beta-lactamase family protein